MSDLVRWKVTATAYCRDCDWSDESEHAEEAAEQHAAERGHEVGGDIHYSYVAEPEESNE